MSNTLLERVLKHFNLENDVEDADRIHESIEKDIVFKGTNLWILMFAIIVASVGLNMNSTAVIIGAMLISPLMGPINGMGYSIATYNFPLFRKAFKNFGFAVVAGLVASTVYFAISPVSSAHSELLARTSPTIYDVLIALFGGLAGIVAITTKQKGNVIPGVAIATALMPPLCTAGYGLATGQFNFFFGAFYLFTINSVFIAISSVVVSQALKLPIRTLVDETQKVKINRWITGVILITIIPSIYFGYGLVQIERFTENAQRFTRNVSVVEGNYLLKYEIDAKRKIIQLIYGGSDLTPAMKDEITATANDFNLQEVTLEFKQGFSFSGFKSGLTEVENLKAEINRLQSLLVNKKEKIDSISVRNHIGEQLLKETSQLYPFITGCIYAESVYFEHDSTKHSKELSLVVFNSNKKVAPQQYEQLSNWLKMRLNNNNLKVLIESNNNSNN